VNFYVLDKNGRHAGAAIYQGPKYTVHDGAQVRSLESAYLFKRRPTP
jgi:hypothetical protein